MDIKPVHVIHCADLHLGFSFSGLNDKSSQRQTELLETLDKIIDLCRTEKADFLLMAGDIFDRIKIDESIADYFIERLSSIPDTIVGITPGNHDPASVDSYYNLKTWPDNVFLFKDSLSFIKFKEKGVCLWGSGFSSTYQNGFPDKSLFRAEDPGLINICIYHGDLLSSEQKSRYNPLTREMIRDSGFDYIAMGHIHKRTEILKENNTYYAYSGPPEGHGFDETGIQGVYSGKISKNDCKMRFIETGKRRYKEIFADISGCESHDEIVEKIIDAVKTEGNDRYAEDLYKIIAEGEVPDNFSVNDDIIASRLKEMLYFVKFFNNTKEKTDLEKIALDETLRGIFASKILEQLNKAKAGKSDKKISDIIKSSGYGFQAFEGEVKICEDNTDTY